MGLDGDALDARSRVLRFRKQDRQDAVPERGLRFILFDVFQRDLPLLQGTILVLALFFVLLNLLVDIAQAAIDPRIKRS